MLCIKCKGCVGDIPLNTIKIELSADEDGVELSYHCGQCHKEFYAVVEQSLFEDLD